MTFINRNWRPLTTAGVVLGIDQASKWLAVRQGFETINSGLSFGLFSSSLLPILLVIGMGIFFFTIAYRTYKHYPVETAAFFAAGSSNLIDRFYYGGVVDFLPLPFTGIKNNLADWVLALTAIMILHRTILDAKESHGS